MAQYEDNDYSHTLLEQEEQHFIFSTFDVQEAFSTFGVKAVLDEVRKNPLINQQLSTYLKSA
jgi:uncharacterized protein (UPF0303 family)